MVLDKNLNTIISVDFETTDESPFNVRVTSDDQISILDVVEHVTKQKRNNCRRTWLDYQRVNLMARTCILVFWIGNTILCEAI